MATKTEASVGRQPCTDAPSTHPFLLPIAADVSLSKILQVGRSSRGCRLSGARSLARGYSGGVPRARECGHGPWSSVTLESEEICPSLVTGLRLFLDGWSSFWRGTR